MSTESATSAVSVDPAVMSGQPVFAGTRVLIQTLFDYIGTGEPLEEFLDGFPTVSEEQALRVIREAAESLLARHGERPPR